MRIRSLLLLSILSVAVRGAMEGPLSPRQALATFDSEPGLKVELVLSEPQIVAPCAIAWDEEGRMYVAENRGYPLGGPNGSPVGRVAMFVDSNRDGLPDRRAEFATGLTYPNGLLPWRGGLIVTCAPDVYYFKDSNGDGIADVKETLLTGFATNQTTQLRVNKPMLARDGWVYLASGLSSGRITSPKSPGTPALELKGDLRFKPDTGEFEGIDGKSQFGQDFDEAGHRFGVFNRVQVRHFVLPSAYLARQPLLASPGTMQDCPELQENPFMRGGGAAAKLYPISANVTTADSHQGTFTAACAIHLWRGGVLPKRYGHGAFSCDPTANLVHFDKLETRGATYVANSSNTGTEFLRSPDSWFRPVYLATGPDGALYICDMYRKSIEHPEYLPVELRKHTDFESGREMGRIWKVSEGKSARPPRLKGRSTRDLAAMLSHEISWIRDTAFRMLHELAAREDARVFARAMRGGNSAGRVSLLALLDQQGALDEHTLLGALDDRDAQVREWAVKLAEKRLPHSEKLQRKVAGLAGDPDSHVRFQAALSLGECPDVDNTASLVRIVSQNPDDKWVRAAVFSSLHQRTKEFTVALLTTASGSQPALFYESAKLSGAGLTATQCGAFLSDILPRSAGTFFENRAALIAGLQDGFKSRNSSKFPLGELDPQSRKEWDVLVKSATEIAQSIEQPVERRLQAVQLLAVSLDAGRAELLLKLVQPEQPGSIQLSAARHLCLSADVASLERLYTKGNWDKFTPALKETLLAGSLSRDDVLSVLLDAIGTGKVPAAAIAGQRRNQLLKHKEQKIRQRAEKLFEQEAPGDRMKAFETSKASLNLKAVPSSGREVFRRSCANCHRLDGEGYAVGPDLFDIRNQPKESILLHIVVPEYEVAPNFSNYIVETRDGRTLTGVLVSETPGSITMRAALGVEENIPRERIQSVAASQLSLMPQELEKTMTMQELADLLAWVKGEK